MKTFVVAGALAAVLLLPSGAAAATSVSVERPCYAEGDSIPINGAGYTPEGQVNISIERGTDILERTEEPRALADGTVDGSYGIANETGWFGATESRFDMTLRLVDQSRLAAGQPAESPDVTATTSFLFSRWNVGVTTPGGKVHPRRSALLRVVGYTNAVGKRIYAHWLRGKRRVHTRSLGLLEGPCGDLQRTLTRGFPFRPVKRGRYRVVFNTSRTDPRAEDSIVQRAKRVTRRIGR